MSKVNKEVEKQIGKICKTIAAIFAVAICLLLVSFVIETAKETNQYKDAVSEGYTVYFNGIKVDKPDQLNWGVGDEIIFNDADKEVYIKCY